VYCLDMKDCSKGFCSTNFCWPGKNASLEGRVKALCVSGNVDVDENEPVVSTGSVEVTGGTAGCENLLKLSKNGFRSFETRVSVGVKPAVPNSACVDAEIFGELRKLIISGVRKKARSGVLRPDWNAAGSNPG
jgi:hypothetical protein